MPVEWYEIGSVPGKGIFDGRIYCQLCREINAVRTGGCKDMGAVSFTGIGEEPEDGAIEVFRAANPDSPWMGRKLIGRLLAQMHSALPLQTSSVEKITSNCGPAEETWTRGVPSVYRSVWTNLYQQIRTLQSCIEAFRDGVDNFVNDCEIEPVEFEESLDPVVASKWAEEDGFQGCTDNAWPGWEGCEESSDLIGTEKTGYDESATGTPNLLFAKQSFLGKVIDVENPQDFLLTGVTEDGWFARAGDWIYWRITANWQDILDAWELYTQDPEADPSVPSFWVTLNQVQDDAGDLQSGAGRQGVIHFEFEFVDDEDAPLEEDPWLEMEWGTNISFEETTETEQTIDYENDPAPPSGPYQKDWRIKLPVTGDDYFIRTKADVLSPATNWVQDDGVYLDGIIGMAPHQVGILNLTIEGTCIPEEEE